MKETFHDSAAPADPVPLRRQRDYRLLWTARTVSLTGSEVSKLAIPLTAITLLSASPSEMGLLTASAFLPALLLGLHSGAIADRMRRLRPLMIACELVSAAAALSVPAAWLLGVLSVPWLVAVALIIGLCAVLFRAANFPYVAALVSPDQRTAANAGFNASYSVAGVAGPGLAGLLVQLITAPLAVLVEGISFLASALLLRSIKAPDDREPRASRGLMRDVAEGLRVTVSRPTIRALLGAGVTINFFATVYLAVFMLYLLHDLGIPTGMIGLLTALSGLGGIGGAWLTTRLAKRYGEDKVLLGSVIFFPLGVVVVGTLDGPLWWKLAALAVSSTVTGAAVVAFATCMGTVIMRDAPAEVLGHVNATTTFAVQGVMTLGGLVGGLLGELIGLRPVVLVSAAGIALSVAWVWLSPLRPGRSRASSDAASGGAPGAASDGAPGADAVRRAAGTEGDTDHQTGHASPAPSDGSSRAVSTDQSSARFPTASDHTSAVSTSASAASARASAASPGAQGASAHALGTSTGTSIQAQTGSTRVQAAWTSARGATSAQANAVPGDPALSSALRNLSAATDTRFL
ncbi:MFS transporter [Thermoactinospora rubra]|uniref:MFS transporter n=1 Tax=Thermoactinospora rubra TaxID=1088767 RepID=UPI000A11127E|nr:MFS transporter [Thermoactinospora rubra]